MNRLVRRGSTWLLMVTTLLLFVSACQQSDLLIIGHRGSPYEATENSREGFEIAYTQGADGVELDVQYTNDGRVIVMHDETVDRTTTCKGAVAALSLADLAGCRLTNGEPVRLLAELLPDMATWFSIVFVEIKVPENKVLSSAEKTAYTDDVVQVVRSSGLAQKIVIISYDRTVLERLATWQEQGIVAGWDASDDSSVALARKYNMPWSLMSVGDITRATCAVAVGLGQRVAVYQVNTPVQFIEAEAAQVSAMMSDSIRTLSAMLGRKKRKLPKEK